jgi:hypothetical protein
MRLTCLLLLVLSSAVLTAQTTLFKEDFNNCLLTPGWEVSSSGNPDPLWYITNSITNDDQNGSSMNGSCFLFIDDDGLGDNTPAYVLDILSPAFDLSQFPTAQLTLDVHYRDWPEGQESFKIFLVDGPEEIELASFSQGQSTGDSLHEYRTLKYDLTLSALSSSARLLFRYDDAGAFNWWAGIDNIEIIGFGVGKNIIAEGFNHCQKPQGWETEILTGDADWSFGKCTNPKAANGNSMDGSCFAFFDDDILGDNAPYSNARLFSPWFDGTEFGTFSLEFDLIHRYYSEFIRLYIQNGNGEEALLGEAAYDIGGPLFNNYQHLAFDISPYRSQQMRVVFEYDDGGSWAWWTGVDNVKVVGNGAANDLCSNARTLQTGPDCTPGSNVTAVFDGPQPACGGKGVASLWYKWQADFSGTALLETNATFNDAVEIFTGSCSNPTLVTCNNRDEHGFSGEKTWFQATSGENYLIRVSGIAADFGLPRGGVCVRILQAPGAPSVPLNDHCASAQSLEVEGPCVSGNNRNAVMSTPLPALNELARADIWYSFTAPALAPAQLLELRSNADFSDIITVYSGGCNNLTEVASNHKGKQLELPALTAGQTYWVQIAGNFATVEGNVCPEIRKKQVNAPINDQCADAAELPMGISVTAGNAFAGSSGIIPPCVPAIEKDIWFRFTAGASGSAWLLSGASFEQTVAVWKGNCGNLENVFCAKNPAPCDGFLHILNLVPGQEYLLQIGCRPGAGGISAGEVQVLLREGAQGPAFEPMEVSATTDCNSLTTARYEIEVQGGVAPFLFEGTQPDAYLNSGENYFTVITDAGGCVKTVAGIVKDCSVSGCTMVASTSKTGIRCFGENNGVLNVTPVGGTPPYTYAWSNGAVTAINDQLAPGIYEVTITDALGCDQILMDTLSNPAQLTVSPTAIVPPTVGESNGSVTMDISGGTGALGYVWTRNGVLFSNVADLHFAPAGDYQLQVTDASGCTLVFNITLTETVSAQAVADDWFAEVFPNPAREKATLALSLPVATDLHISILDAAGRLLRSHSYGQVTEQNIALEIKDLPAGAYRVRVRGGDRVLDRKLMISH